MTDPGWVGKVLGGRYHLDSLLGQGGMSSVYKATDPNLKRNVAVKLIHTHLTNDPEFVRRFEVEASAVAQLHHPNIIQVYDFNRDGDTYYMVLEFVPGESLDRRLRRLAAEGRRMRVEQAARVTAEVADAMDYAHTQGLIHRDIKPANIMIDERGHAVLMDFGLAKIVGATQHTATGAVMGTASYIAPELVRGQSPSPSSDIYALGASLFEMLAGRPPFTGDSAMSVMMKHLSEPTPDLRQIAPQTPPAIAQVAETALAKEPGQRFASARDMLAALEAAMPGVTLLASKDVASRLNPPAPPIAAVTPPTLLVDEEPAGPAAPAVQPAPSNPPVAASSTGARVAGEQVQRRGGRSLWLAAGAAALLLCLVVTGTGLVGGVLVLPFMVTTPTPAPPGTPEVLYQDDFSSSSSSWPTGSGANASGAVGSLSFDQGAYVIKVVNSRAFIWAAANLSDFSNIHAEVTAANTGQATDAGFGLMCDYTDGSHYYYFGITANGEYAIMKMQPSHVTVLTDDRGQWVQSDRITPGQPSYRVGVDCGANGTLTLYADGLEVATAKDTTYTSGTVGLFVQTGTGAPAELRYQNLVVTALR